jgi:hypothetical protein
MSVSPCLLTRYISKDAFAGSPECMWRCLRLMRSNTCPNSSVAYCYFKKSVLRRCAYIRAAAAYRLLSSGAGTGDTAHWLISSTSSDQGHAERAEGLGQIDACEMSTLRPDVVLPFYVEILVKTVAPSSVPLMLSGQRGISL